MDLIKIKDENKFVCLIIISIEQKIKAKKTLFATLN
jgi:hypothetical protein